ncbi:MAG: cupin domain-containing protein [Desulfuromusa sp.]|nr:cupin domain-containing protein [Desulfuromusa sp.]
MNKVNLEDKFSQFNGHWQPKVVGELNDQYVKLAKLKGEFVWHQHETEDELFMVIKGELLIKLRDRDVILKPGEFFIIPRRVEHLPVAQEEVEVMLFEPKSVVNTGDIKNERTLDTAEFL